MVQREHRTRATLVNSNSLKSYRGSQRGPLLSLVKSLSTRHAYVSGRPAQTIDAGVLPARRASPSARPRSRRRTAGGGKRVMPPNAGIRKYPRAQLRHGRAGCAPAFPLKWPPSALRASTSARRRSRRRTAGGGRRNGAGGVGRREAPGMLTMGGPRRVAGWCIVEGAQALARSIARGPTA